MLLALEMAEFEAYLVDIVIGLILLLGIYLGYQRGFIKSAFKFVSTFAAFIFSYALKNKVSVFLYTHLPFFKLGGFFKGITSLNILIYEVIAFVLVFTFVMLLVEVIWLVTGLVGNLISKIKLLNFPNKLFGTIIGFLEAVVIVYFLYSVALFGSNFFDYNVKSHLGDRILEIPILNKNFGDTFDALGDITALAKEYPNASDKDAYNLETLNILLKYKILTKENAQKLVDQEKIVIPNVQELLDRY